MMIPDGLLASASEVFTLFLIPIGGGIPAGVVLGHSRGLEWPLMLLLYFFSDVVLACVFEPIMHIFIKWTQHSPNLARFLQEYKKNLEKTGVKFGSIRGTWSLVLISFGVDPMTGRVVTHKAGHGFITGWAIAICGDLFFFTLIMASTLWLNNILGDGTTTAIIIMVAMFGIPMLIDRWRMSRRKE